MYWLRLLYCIALIVVTHVGYGQTFTITDFDSDITVTDDGRLLVQENIDVTFHKTQRGIFRNVPFKYSFEGQKLEVDLTDIAVTGHDYQVSTKGRDKVIRIGNPDIYLTGPQSYTISYTVGHPILQHESYQELYWNVTGTEWPTTIENASVTIHMPKALALSTDELQVWAGRSGSKDRKAAISQVDVETFSAATSQALKKGEGLTLAIRMPSDYLDLPAGALIKSTTTETSDHGSQNPGWLAIPIALLGLVAGWWKSMRSREITPVYNKIYEAYPPEGLTSAHVGAYIDHMANQRDVMSLIPYWAAEGYLTMKYDNGLSLHKKDALPSDFPEYEKEFFDAIFKKGNTIYVENMNGRLAGIIAKTSRRLTAEVGLQEYYDDDYRAIWRSWPVALMILLPLGLGLWNLIAGYSIWLGVGLLVAAVGIMIMAIYTTPLSPKGKELMAKLKAFERFVKETPDDMLSDAIKDNPKYFDRILPFAIAFGVDKQWLQQVQPYMTESPSWYDHSSGAGFPYFISGYNTKTIGKSFTYDPAQVSSGGSFSSGGGSVGGGFGGGGGGSW